MTMPAGRYWIGDLCYVLEDSWDGCCDLFFAKGSSGEGEFQLKDGRKFASFRTKWGDGVYVSNQGSTHSVDSGTIGCILVKDTDGGFVSSLGATFEFDRPFEVSSSNGLLKFGNITIDTL
jgi:hypothetical protein